MLNYAVQPGVSWVKITPASGKIDKQTRLWASVDWSKAPEGIETVPVTITGNNGEKTTVQLVVNNTIKLTPGQTGFVESNGYVSMEATHYTKGRKQRFHKMVIATRLRAYACRHNAIAE